ncbi:uncharacterized protein [Arachis hypogaea]|uniref:uncharacterized protein n=1 Tax=Arachis hypogaea TaxID=3818 RepID=UPI003B222B1E
MECQAKDPNMKRYLEKTLEHLQQFSDTKVRHITRELNSRADSLSKLASTKLRENNRSLIQEALKEPSVIKSDSKSDILSVSGSNLRWMIPRVECLKFDILPKKCKEAKRIRRKSHNYTLVQNVLYRRGVFALLLKCVLTSRTEEALEEVHNDIYGNHLGARSLARNEIRAGFLWLTLQKDATDFVKK